MDTFLAGWTPKGDQLVCYRDWKYSLVMLNGKRSLEGKVRNAESRIPGANQSGASQIDQAIQAMGGTGSTMKIGFYALLQVEEKK
jgi:hypothetical protein